ncbi:CYTH and CHAD domain-containing protein [Nitrosospira sp. NpAV]|uniref:CYTH and CHAD domain-containing protein n=1 Tax=Nitrosospira sp. NpAV TaxID=58133 RepID=UPI000697A31A|nr:CYTH and CHAD domain-containing protein [Nitrosospira sp. NpAV]
MPTEIELKLRLPPAATARLQRNPLLKSLSISNSVTRKLYSIYYDTPDFALRRNGIALRLRREGKQWVQTIKGGGSAAAGLHQRDESEAPVLKARPDFTKISDPQLIKLISTASLREQLHPVFTTVFNRHTRILRLPDGGEAEFCLDRGTIVAGDISTPICEIELELESGSPLPLFQLAQDLLHDIPLRLENVSKAERGYVLASGSGSPPLKAQPVQLAAEMSVSEAFKAITWNCLGHLHSNEAGMLDGSDIEYLHQMRVALRRQRSALSIFSRVFSKTAFLPIAQELKWLAGQFGPARDWDVFVKETFAAVYPAFPNHQGMVALRGKCERLRRHHNDTARKAIESRHYTELMLKLGAWLCTESWLAQPDLAASDNPAGRSDVPVREFAGTLLAHRHRQLKKYGKKLESLSVPELHALRIVAKKQRYAAEFFAGFFPHKESTKRYIQSLSTLQDILGAMNDTAVVERLLSEVSITRDESGEHEAAGIIRGWSASLALIKKQELNAAWKHFHKNDPFW